MVLEEKDEPDVGRGLARCQDQFLCSAEGVAPKGKPFCLIESDPGFAPSTAKIKAEPPYRQCQAVVELDFVLSLWSLEKNKSILVRPGPK